MTTVTIISICLAVVLAFFLGRCTSVIAEPIAWQSRKMKSRN